MKREVYDGKMNAGYMFAEGDELAHFVCAQSFSSYYSANGFFEQVIRLIAVSKESREIDREAKRNCE